MMRSVYRVAVKCFAWGMLGIGRVLRRSRPRYDFATIRKILINKCDRLGDAVVILPLLLELQKHYQITVLTSERNDEFLRRFVPTKKYIAEPKSFHQVLRMLLSGCAVFWGKRGSKDPDYDLYLDFNGLKELDVFFKVWKDALCAHHASFNMGFWNGMLDYSHRDYPVLFSRRPVLDSYAQLVCEALGVEITLASVGGAHAVFPEEMPPGDFVIINVSGHERYRGPALVFYAELIKEIAQRLGCFIMDELGGTHMPAIKEMTRGTDNVYYAERDFSIWELAGLASKARGYLGADSGISHLMGGLTNAIVFFGDQTSEIWRPYVPSGYEKCEYKEGFILERSVDPSGFLKAVIYQPVRCRPCFDWGCRRPVCVDAFLAVKEPLINVVLELFRSCGAIPGAVDL